MNRSIVIEESFPQEILIFLKSVGVVLDEMGRVISCLTLRSALLRGSILRAVAAITTIRITSFLVCHGYVKGKLPSSQIK